VPDIARIEPADSLCFGRSRKRRAGVFDKMVAAFDPAVEKLRIDFM
jgi:hypothetical protein